MQEFLRPLLLGLLENTKLSEPVGGDKMQEVIRETTSIASSNSSPQEIIFKLFIVSLLTYLIGLVYIKFGRSVSNRPSLASSLPMLGITTMLVITVVKSSLALSLGLVGALSIVRFRTPIKEPEELNYLFFSIAIGLAIGADQYLVAFLGAIFTSVYIILRSKGSRFTNVSRLGSFTSIIRFNSELDEAKILEVIKEHCEYVSLKRFTNTSTKETEICLSLIASDISNIISIKNFLKEISDDIEVDFLDTSKIIGSN